MIHKLSAVSGAIGVLLVLSACSGHHDDDLQGFGPSNVRHEIGQPSVVLGQLGSEEEFYFPHHPSENAGRFRKELYFYLGRDEVFIFDKYRLTERRPISDMEKKRLAQFLYNEWNAADLTRQDAKQ